jgi:hypothetical protein
MEIGLSFLLPAVVASLQLLASLMLLASLLLLVYIQLLGILLLVLSPALAVVSKI